MIACFLSNISAKYYKNPSMLSRVIAKNVGGVFLRHSVDQIRLACDSPDVSVMIERRRMKFVNNTLNSDHLRWFA